MDEIRPSRLYVACSVLVISISIHFVCWACAGMLYPHLIVGSVIFLPLPVATAVLQHVAASSRSPGAAKGVAVLLFATNGLLLVTVAGTVVAGGRPPWIEQCDLCVFVADAAGGWPPWGLLGFLAGLAAISAFGMFCGWLNLQWAECLRDWIAADPAARRKPFQFSLRDLLVFAVIIALTMQLAMWLIRGTPR